MLNLSFTTLIERNVCGASAKHFFRFCLTYSVSYTELQIHNFAVFASYYSILNQKSSIFTHHFSIKRRKSHFFSETYSQMTCRNIHVANYYSSFHKSRTLSKLKWIDTGTYVVPSTKRTRAHT